MQHGSIQYLAHEWRWSSGKRNGFAPFDWLQIDRPQEIEESAAHLFVTSVDDENPGFIRLLVTLHCAAISWMVFSESGNYLILETRKMKSPCGGFHGGFWD